MRHNVAELYSYIVKFNSFYLSILVTLAPRITGARVAFTDKESTKQVVRWWCARELFSGLFL
jgi:hypothetical protein